MFPLLYISNNNARDANPRFHGFEVNAGTTYVTFINAPNIEDVRAS